MKKTLLVIATLAACGASIAQTAPAAPTFSIYGRFDVALESSDDGKTQRTLVQDQSSRLGFRGQQMINADLSGIAQVETGFAFDDNSNSNALANRNSFVGLSSKSMGTLLVGNFDSPFKTLEGTANQLWGSAEAMEIITHGKGTGRVASNWTNLHTRQKNVIHYASPKFSNIVVKAAYSPDACADPAAGGSVCTTSRTMNGFSAEYNDGTYNVGIATESRENANAAAPFGNMTGTKVTGGMKAGPISVGVAYSKLDNGLNKSTNNWLATGSYAMGPVVLKANYGTSSESSSGAADALSMFGLQVDYALARGYTVYGYYTSIDNDSKARGRFENGATKYSPVAGDDPKAFGVGIRYNF